MRLLFSLVICLIYSLSYSNADDTQAQSRPSNDIPVLIYSRLKSNEIRGQFPIGSTIDSNNFEQQLARIFPASANQNMKQKRISIILLPFFQWTEVVKQATDCKDIEQDIIFKYPSVHEGYTTTIDYLNQNGFKADIIEASSLSEGLKKICELRRHNDGIVLTSLDINNPENDRHSAKNHRQARQISSSSFSSNTTTDTMLFGDQCAALFNSIVLTNSTISSAAPINTELEIDDANSMFDCCKNCTKATLTLKFKPGKDEYVTQLMLIFQRANREWKYVNGTIETTARNLSLKYMELPYSFETPIGYSYVCTSTRFKLTDPLNPKTFRQRIELYFNKFQFQPFDVKNNQTLFTFGVVNYCSGFFSNGIWMGVATSLLMAAILAIGVYLMLNVNTMDRFDDPKGKPLTIAAEK